eukprot:Skav204352  [mRNA]  locus=scaffold866:500:1387:+ [translate_table: standard]
MADIIFYQNVISGFLVMDAAENGAHSARVWPMILSLCYPFLNGKDLCQSLIILILRGRQNQRKADVHDFVEVFAGCARLTLEMIRAGFEGSAFDLLFNPVEQNVLDSKGLRLVIDALSCVKYGGLCWIATKCSSFVSLCLCQSQRSATNNFMGDETRPFVRNGNDLMQISSLLFLLAYLCGLWPVVEQPLSSVLPDCPAMRTVLRFTSARKCVTYLGSYEGPSQKPLQLWSPWHRVQTLHRPKPMDLVAAEPLARRHGDSDERFTGNKELLRESEAYTAAFGKAVVQLCQAEWAT